MNGNKKKLFFTSIWIVNHFGKNPMKGGRPPKERKFIIKNIFIGVLKLILQNNCWIKKILKILKIIIILNEIKA